ncbi:MAG: HlyD family type I secretion periplasmic adaptor subunit [Alphaproteobacteria bacterium]|nr:HlyD family type I secretion periplasmic adaptor subunit [Alphaproteobacteria bacterium]
MRMPGILPFGRRDTDEDERGDERRTSLALQNSGFARAIAPARYADFLPDAQAIAAREHSPLARILIIAVAVFTILALFWAAVASVEKVATAPGRVRPDSRVKIINHSEGGRVAEIFVVEGQRVAGGDPLVEFDRELLEDEVARLREEWATFAAQAARLEAESVNADAVVFPASLDGVDPALLTSQRELFRSRRSGFAARQLAADESVTRFEREAEALRDRIGSLEETVAIRADQEDATRRATEQGYYSRLRYLAIKNQLVESEGQLASRREELAAKQAQLAEARKRREQIEEEYYSDVLERLVESRQQRDSLARELSQAETEKTRLVVRAPVDGIVQNLTVTSVGQSVNENEPMMNVVPTGDTLIIEARVSNEDIGFIELGQDAEIRVNTYDFVKFGTLRGKVTQIAADATEDPGSEGSVFNYVVLLKTDKTHLGPTPQDQPVVPGMQVTADFKIGERTILSFLTDRVAQTAETALRER